MQSTATVINELLFFAGLDDLLAAVEPGRAHVVAQVRLAARRLDRDRGRAQMIMRAPHAAAGRRLLVLVNCHLYDSSLLLVVHQTAPPGERRNLLGALARARRLAILVARRIRHGED